MRTKTIGFAMTALLAPAIFGQTSGQPATQDRLLRLTHTATVPEFREIANLVRTITEIRDVSADDAQMTLAVRGTTEQLGLAEWLVRQLDQPVGGAISPLSAEYKGLSDTDERRNAITDGVARIFYLPNMATVQDFQETVNAIRTVTEIRRMFTYQDGRAMVARGTPAQIAMAEWLVHQLDQPAQQKSSAVGEYRVGDDDVMRVFYVANAKSVSDFQDLANGVRTMPEIRRMFTINTPRAVLVRCTPDQMAMAEWLLGQLDKPTDAQPSQASGEYRVPDSVYASASSPHDDIVRVFYVAPAKSAQDFKQIASVVRSFTPMVFPYNAQRALAVRGTPSQMALAEKLIHDLDGPSR